MDFSTHGEVAEEVIVATRDGRQTDGKIGWGKAGMAPIENILREDPSLAGTVKKLMEGPVAKSTR